MCKFYQIIAVVVTLFCSSAYASVEMKIAEQVEITKNELGLPALGLSNDQFDRVHTGTREYDLTVDTSNSSVFDVAKEIINFIENNPNPNGFNNMRGMLA